MRLSLSLMRGLAALLLLPVVTPCSASAAIYYVNGTTGSDQNGGLSSADAVITIQEAARRAGPGDRIMVARGVYFGPIELSLKGTAEDPVTIEAEDRSLNAVVITNARKDLREGRASWEAIDETLGLYRTFLEGGTARVLYSGTDLQPYSSLDGLRAFVTKDGQPGPAHGYFYDTQARQIYVRLHASGRYGPAEPARHVMSAGPRTGNGYAGTSPNGPSFYCLGLMTRGDMHVVVDGFTFETPGFAGVYVNGHRVTVRHSWFVGCRVGVAGRKESANPDETSNHISVENCDYSQFPAFDDMMEVMTERRPAAGAPKYPLYWWSRKGGGTGSALTYELGICGAVGSNWTLAHNRIHDAFEGLSTWCVRWSKAMRIHDNLFERLVDNAVEMEDHAEDMRIYRNIFLNTIEPLSWQPLGGTPWPGPVYVYGNLIRNDRELNRRVVEKAGHLPGWFKAGATDTNWTSRDNQGHMAGVPKDKVRAAGAGVVVFNNTVIYPGGRFLTLTQPNARIFENFHFINNIVVAETFSGKPGYRAANMIFRNNLWIGPAEADGSGKIFAGECGEVTDFGLFAEPAPEDFLVGDESPAFAKGVQVPEALAVSSEAGPITNRGAILDGRAWARPTTGPQPR